MIWKHLKQYMYDALIKSYEEQELTNTQKCSVLSLIHKKGDLDKPQNYRPISLTNCDYKIIACVFSRRLKKFMNKLINPDQSGL